MMRRRMPHQTENRRAATPAHRAILIGLGVMALGLGVVGIILPVVPASPFFVLALACFARASTRFHAWLTSQPQLHQAMQWLLQSTNPIFKFVAKLMEWAIAG